jgi:hypothetical protein
MNNMQPLFTINEILHHSDLKVFAVILTEVFFLSIENDSAILTENCFGLNKFTLKEIVCGYLDFPDKAFQPYTK